MQGRHLPYIKILIAVPYNHDLSYTELISHPVDTATSVPPLSGLNKDLPGVSNAIFNPICIITFFCNAMIMGSDDNNRCFVAERQ